MGDLSYDVNGLQMLYTVLDYICDKNLYERVSTASNVLNEGFASVQVRINVYFISKVQNVLFNGLTFKLTLFFENRFQERYFYIIYFILQDVFPNIIETTFCNGTLCEIHFTDEVVKQQADLMLLNKGKMSGCLINIYVFKCGQYLLNKHFTYNDRSQIWKR